MPEKTCGQRFLLAVNENQQLGSSYTDAWIRAKKLHPELYAGMDREGREAIARRQAKLEVPGLTAVNTRKLAATRRISELIRERVRLRGEDFETAYRVCKLHHPELFQESPNPKA